LVEGLEEINQPHGVEGAAEPLTCFHQDGRSVSLTIQQGDNDSSSFSQLDHLAQ